MKNLKEYIGDGVYADFDGYHIVLTLDGQDSTTRICLDPGVFQELINYANTLHEHIKKVKEK